MRLLLDAMKLARTIVIVAAAALPVRVAIAQAESVDLDIYLTVTTDYFYRGLSQSDGAAAVQIGVDYLHRSGFFVGAWASNVDYAAESLRARPRRLELDYYLGFNRQPGDLSWTLTLARYRYPDISVSYDYSEISGNVEFGKHLMFRMSYTDSLLAVGQSALNAEFGGMLAVPWDMELGATLGRFESDDLQDGGYTHWNIGLSKLVGRFGLDLRYYDTRFDAKTHLGSPADRRWVLSASYGFKPMQRQSRDPQT